MVVTPINLTAFAVTLLASLALVLTQRWHGRFSLDGAVGVQKMHTQPTPRIGGVAIVLGLLGVYHQAGIDVQALLGPMLLAGIPAFAAGLLGRHHQKSRRTSKAAGLHCQWRDGLVTQRRSHAKYKLDRA
jgi:UDP-N-acetylmuramyl pentapeptide phosphotransferase/UDP-N-acetylglucosamine-1-phosphate transferase